MAFFHMPGSAALLAAGIGLAGAQMPAFATPDLTIVPVVCTPGGVQTMDNELKLAVPGVVRQLGPNPPRRLYYCPVSGPDDLTTQPSWGHLKLMYQDLSPFGIGNAVARLYAKSLGTIVTDPPMGITFPVAAVSSVPFAGVNVVSAPFGALDFSRFSYFITLELNKPSVQIDAHMVMLTNK